MFVVGRIFLQLVVEGLKNQKKKKQKKKNERKVKNTCIEVKFQKWLTDNEITLTYLRGMRPKKKKKCVPRHQAYGLWGYQREKLTNLSKPIQSGIIIYKGESRNPSHQHFLLHQVINKKSSLIYQTNKTWDLPIKLNPRGIYIVTQWHLTHSYWVNSEFSLSQLHLVINNNNNVRL